MDQNVAEKLSEALSQQVGKIRYCCAGEGVPPDMAVHEIRKSCKRIRALLRFYRNTPPQRSSRIARKIRRLGKKLSPLRDSRIFADLFGEFLSAVDPTPGKHILEAGEKTRRKNRDMLKGDSGMDMISESVKEDFSSLDTVLAELAESGVSLRDITGEISFNYRKSYRLFMALPDEYPGDLLHALRKKMKRLYYQIDFLWQLKPGRFGAKGEQLDLINDQLGKDHDLHIWLEDLRSPEYRFKEAELAILEEYVLSLRGGNLFTLLPRLKEFFAGSPEEFDQALERFTI